MKVIESCLPRSIIHGFLVPGTYCQRGLHKPYSAVLCDYNSKRAESRDVLPDSAPSISSYLAVGSCYKVSYLCKLQT